MGDQVPRTLRPSCRLQLDRDIDERQGRPAESFVFAKDQREIALNAGIGQRKRRQHLGLKIFDHIGSRNEADAHAHGDKALQQFAGVQLHRNRRLEASLVEQSSSSASRVRPTLGSSSGYSATSATVAFCGRARG